MPRQTFTSQEIREEKPCNVCGCDDYRIVHKWPANYYDHDIYETCSWDGRQDLLQQIVQCSRCKFVYSRPSFKEEALHLVYPTDLITHIKDSDVKESLRINEKHYQILNIIRKHFPTGGTLVDIGTRYGGLPFIAREQGYNAFGLEYNTESVEVAKKLNRNYIFPGTIMDLSDFLSQGKIPALNILTMIHVLEHLVDANRDFSIIANLQQPGDGVVLDQPNQNSAGRFLHRKNWYAYQPAAHMFYFSPASAGRLLENNGYRVVAVYKMPFHLSFPCSIIKACMRMARRLLGREKPWKMANGKLNYLMTRKWGYDDFFTIVGVKTG